MHFEISRDDRSLVKWPYKQQYQQQHMKEHKEICGGNDCVWYLSYGDGITDVHVSDSPRCIP